MRARKIIKKHKKSFQKRRALHYRARRRLPFHKRLVLHPLTLFVYLSVGVGLIFASVQVSATNILVTAKVSAPPITEPAVIQIVAPSSSPTQATAAQDAKSVETAVVVRSKQIILSGECPKASHLEFYRNGMFAGVAPCIGDPTFSISLDLVEGINAISAKVFNLTDDEGPISQMIYIKYDTSSENTSTSTSTDTSTSTSTEDKPATPFFITSDFRYLGFNTGETAKWKIHILGGTAPYMFEINWGDGKSDSIKRLDDADFDITHIYQKASSNTGYIITITANDVNKVASVFQMMSIISEKGSHQAGLISVANNNLNPSVLRVLQKWIWAAWPAYILFSLLIFSFWLGERREYLKLRAHKY